MDSIGAAYVNYFKMHKWDYDKGGKTTSTSGFLGRVWTLSARSPQNTIRSPLTTITVSIYELYPNPVVPKITPVVDLPTNDVVVHMAYIENPEDYHDQENKSVALVAHCKNGWWLWENPK